MIELTRLNGNRMVVNSDLILCAESSPDTLLTLVTGEKLIVMESIEELVDRAATYRARTLAEASSIALGEPSSSAGAAGGMAARNARQVSREAIEEESAMRSRRRRRRKLL